MFFHFKCFRTFALACILFAFTAYVLYEVGTICSSISTKSGSSLSAEGHSFCRTGTKNYVTTRDNTAGTDWAC